jgi:predicted nucleic acid-binding protein
MIILDTDVISALMRRSPDRAVLDWLNRQDRGQIHTSAINIFELRFGLLIRPDDENRRRLAQGLEALLTTTLAGRVLPFDSAAADAAATLEARRKLAGELKGARDVQIAGVVISRGASLCTRNVRHFEDAEIPLTNPWA